MKDTIRIMITSKINNEIKIKESQDSIYRSLGSDCRQNTLRVRLPCTFCGFFSVLTL